MKKVFLLLCLVTVVATGCRKKIETAPAAENPPAPPPPTATETKAEAATPAAETSATEPVPVKDLNEFQASVELADLSKELNIFVFQKHRWPADLNELSRASGMKLPTPPPGTKLVMDKNSKSVKAVPVK